MVQAFGRLPHPASVAVCVCVCVGGGGGGLYSLMGCLASENRIARALIYE